MYSLPTIDALRAMGPLKAAETIRAWALSRDNPISSISEFKKANPVFVKWLKDGMTPYLRHKFLTSKREK